MIDAILGDVVLLLFGVIEVGGVVITLVGGGLLAAGIIRGRRPELFDDIGPKIMRIAGVVMLIIGMLTFCVTGVAGAGYFVENYAIRLLLPGVPLL